jgi:hypothetical protein
MAVLRRIRRAALLLCLPVLLARCGRTVPERPSETVRDLIADLDLAEIQREPVFKEESDKHSWDWGR